MLSALFCLEPPDQNVALPLDPEWHAVTPSLGPVTILTFVGFLRLSCVSSWGLHLTDHHLKEHRTLRQVLSCGHRPYFMEKEG